MESDSCFLYALCLGAVALAVALLSKLKRFLLGLSRCLAEKNK